MKAGLDRMPADGRAARSSTRWRAPYGVTSVHAGAGRRRCTRSTLEQRVRRSSSCAVDGQTDILTMGLPYICPYNVNSMMNPILVMCLGLGYFFNLYRGQPARARGRRADHDATRRRGSSTRSTTPATSTSSSRCWPRPPTRSRSSSASRSDFAEDEWYRHLYRTSYAYHGVHPFYMWYWGAHALEHLGERDHRRRRAPVGAPARLPARVDAATTRSRWPPTWSAAHPTITHFHNPPLVMADVHD